MNKQSTLILCIWCLLICFSIGCAAYMAIKGIDGWGWFLVVGVLLAAGLSYSDNDKEEKEEEG
jgi:hypothetical protein